jgi:hypothetical protein
MHHVFSRGQGSRKHSYECWSMDSLTVIIISYHHHFYKVINTHIWWYLLPKTSADVEQWLQPWPHCTLMSDPTFSKHAVQICCCLQPAHTTRHKTKPLKLNTTIPWLFMIMDEVGGKKWGHRKWEDTIFLSHHTILVNYLQHYIIYRKSAVDMLCAFIFFSTTSVCNIFLSNK